MKGMLEFELPEEKDEFWLAGNAGTLISAIREFQEFLRGLEKYGHSFSSIEQTIHEIRQKFFQILEDDDILSML